MSKRLNWDKPRQAELLQRPLSENPRLEKRANAYLAAADHQKKQSGPWRQKRRKRQKRKQK